MPCLDPDIPILICVIRNAVLGVVLVSFLVLSGCGPQSAIVLALDSLQVATAAALPLLAVAGVIPPAMLPALESGLANISNATQLSAAELATSDSAADKAAKIEGYFSNAVLATEGLPPEAKAIIEAVNAAVKAFLAQAHLANSHALMQSPRLADFSVSDKLKLRTIKHKAMALSQQIQDLQ